MSGKHTPGPWRVSSEGLTIEDANGAPIARLIGTRGRYQAEVANAKRIVACVNFCEGVDDFQMKSAPITTVAAINAKRISDETRNDLLNALNGLVDAVVNRAPVDHLEGYLRTAERAIAKATGGAA